jgi:hypothetical protein
MRIMKRNTRNKMELQYRRNTTENIWTLKGDYKDQICLYVGGRTLFFPEDGSTIFLIKNVKQFLYRP